MKTLSKSIFVLFLIVISNRYSFAQDSTKRATKSLVSSFVELGVGGTKHSNSTNGNGDLFIVSNGQKYELTAGMAYKNTGICFTTFYERNDLSLNATQTHHQIYTDYSYEADPTWNSKGFLMGMYHDSRQGIMCLSVKMQGGVVLIDFPEFKTKTNYPNYESHWYFESSAVGVLGSIDAALGVILPIGLSLKAFATLTAGKANFAVSNLYYDSSSGIGVDSEIFTKTWSSTAYGVRVGYSFQL